MENLKQISNYIQQGLVHFEGEDLHSFLPYSNERENIIYDTDSFEGSWFSMEPGEDDKPLVGILDVETNNGELTERVKGLYIIDDDYDVSDKEHALIEDEMAYIAFEKPIDNIIKKDAKSGLFSYHEGFKERVFQFISNDRV